MPSLTEQRTMVEGRNKAEMKTHCHGPTCKMLVCRGLHLMIRSQQKCRSVIMNTTQLDLLNCFKESDTPESASGEIAERQVAKKRMTIHTQQGETSLCNLNDDHDCRWWWMQSCMMQSSQEKERILHNVLLQWRKKKDLIGFQRWIEAWLLVD
jgi:hypothetical protein